MVNLSLCISNPWSKRWELVSSQHKMLWGLWAWESAIYRTNQILAVELELKLRTDHQGLRLSFGLFGYTLEFSLYDRLHWSDRQRQKSRRRP